MSSADVATWLGYVMAGMVGVGLGTLAATWYYTRPRGGRTWPLPTPEAVHPSEVTPWHHSTTQRVLLGLQDVTMDLIERVYALEHPTTPEPTPAPTEPERVVAEPTPGHWDAVTPSGVPLPGRDPHGRCVPGWCHPYAEQRATDPCPVSTLGPVARTMAYPATTHPPRDPEPGQPPAGGRTSLQDPVGDQGEQQPMPATPPRPPVRPAPPAARPRPPSGMGTTTHPQPHPWPPAPDKHHGPHQPHNR